MTFLDEFALLVLLVLLGVTLAAAIALAMWPGRIARERNHHNADAINVCVWLGLLSLGILWPVAFVWAFTKPPSSNS